MSHSISKFGTISVFLIKIMSIILDTKIKKSLLADISSHLHKQECIPPTWKKSLLADISSHLHKQECIPPTWKQTPFPSKGSPPPPVV